MTSIQRCLPVQLYGRRKRRHGPLLPQSILACNPVWQLPLNNIETDQWALHHVHISVNLAADAEVVFTMAVIKKIYTAPNQPAFATLVK